MPSTPGVAGRFRTGGRRLFKELGAFGVVGIVCFFIDVGLFQLLYAYAGVGAVTAKTLSTSVAMTAAYVGHRSWSFSHRAPINPRRGYLLFVAINLFTLALGASIVALVRYPLAQESVLVIQVVNVGTIVLSTVVRYTAYRRWVFPARVDEPRAEARIVA